MTDDIEAIRARHEADPYDRSQAVADRATLLALVDRLVAELAKISAWTDDDQRGLNAAVADAMWHWDDMPMDCDDATVLTSVLKSSLQDNGFQIVRLKGT